MMFKPPDTQVFFCWFLLLPSPTSLRAYKYWKSLEYSKSPDEFLIPFWFSQLSGRYGNIFISIPVWYVWRSSIVTIVSAYLYWHPMIQNIDNRPTEDNQHQDLCFAFLTLSFIDSQVFGSMTINFCQYGMECTITFRNAFFPLSMGRGVFFTSFLIPLIKIPHL